MELLTLPSQPEMLSKSGNWLSLFWEAKCSLRGRPLAAVHGPRRPPDLTARRFTRCAAVRCESPEVVHVNDVGLKMNQGPFTILAATASGCKPSAL